MMTRIEARGILEREIADMDESELRTALMIVARHMGEDRALPLVLRARGSDLPDAEEIGRTIVRAIEGSDDDFAMECYYEKDYDRVESPEESALRYTSRMRRLLRHGRGPDGSRKGRGGVRPAPGHRIRTEEGPRMA